MSTNIPTKSNMAINNSSSKKTRKISNTPVSRPVKEISALNSTILALQEQINKMKNLSKEVKSERKKENNKSIFEKDKKSDRKPVNNLQKIIPIDKVSHKKTKSSVDPVNKNLGNKENLKPNVSLNKTILFEQRLNTAKEIKSRNHDVLRLVPKRIAITPIRNMNSVEKNKNSNLSINKIVSPQKKKYPSVNLTDLRPLSERGTIKDKDLIQMKINKIQKAQKKLQSTNLTMAKNKTPDTKNKNFNLKTIDNKNISYTSLITNEENYYKKEDENSYISTSNITVTASNKPIKMIKQMFEISKTGYSGNQRKINQDSYFIYKNFSLCEDSIFLGVCDGHGATGHEVSNFLKENLPDALNNEILKKHLKNKSSSLSKLIEEVFLSMNIEVFLELTIDTNFSGSTCCSIIFTPERIICANVGDSRCVLGRFLAEEWKAHPLSRDHKPSDKDESERILKKKGRIEPYRDSKGNFLGPMRVWIQQDSIPGLAMSRSFGDKIASTVGVIALPEITEWSFTKEDKFIILGSDGIWEFISSQESVEIVKEFYLKNDVAGACEMLVEEATKRWIREDTIIDDITVIVIFLDN